MVGKGFFISPNNFIVPIDVHIETIYERPEAFGYTKKAIARIYESYNEKPRLEGNARERIIREVVKRGWIRGRKYDNKGNEYLTLNVYELNEFTLLKLKSLAGMILDGKVYDKAGLYDEVRISEFSTNKVLRYELKDLCEFANGKGNTSEVVITESTIRDMIL